MSFSWFSLCLQMRRVLAGAGGGRRGGNSPCHLRISYLGVKYTACTPWLAIHCSVEQLYGSLTAVGKDSERLSLIRCTAPLVAGDALVTCVIKVSLDFLAGKTCLPREWSSATELKPLKIWRLSWIFNCSQQKMLLVLSSQHTCMQIIKKLELSGIS